ncbi:unnamed protein product [Acanthoscelides obtectus]|uniref:Uncharacterized protein n=1 Tax=Acanthoscelides obtectus TaxID=200917 RepID=A0A9P0P805_ACAOB|nr:unnamed protein product [Acanthoscelides obtectus]CAK1654488.1 hypothetical protein AOBTE_LOCUS18638 [Acanthoscelides obtectus]
MGSVDYRGIQGKEGTPHGLWRGNTSAGWYLRVRVRDYLPPTDNHNIHSQEKNFSWDGIRTRTAHGD